MVLVPGEHIFTIDFVDPEDQPNDTTVVASDGADSVTVGESVTIDLSTVVSITNGTGPLYSVLNHDGGGYAEVSGSNLTYYAGFESASVNVTYRVSDNGVSDTATITLTPSELFDPIIAPSALPIISNPPWGGLPPNAFSFTGLTKAQAHAFAADIIGSPDNFPTQGTYQWGNNTAQSFFQAINSNARTGWRVYREGPIRAERVYGQANQRTRFGPWDGNGMYETFRNLFLNRRYTFRIVLEVVDNGVDVTGVNWVNLAEIWGWLDGSDTGRNPALEVQLNGDIGGGPVIEVRQRGDDRATHDRFYQTVVTGTIPWQGFGFYVIDIDTVLDYRKTGDGGQGYTKVWINQGLVLDHVGQNSYNSIANGFNTGGQPMLMELYGANPGLLWSIIDFSTNSVTVSGDATNHLTAGRTVRLNQSGASESDALFIADAEIQGSSLFSGNTLVIFTDDIPQSPTPSWLTPNVGVQSYIHQMKAWDHGAIAPPPPASSDPIPPQAFVDTDYDPAYTRAPDIVVNSGDDLQAAFDAAVPGDIIEVEAGATFTGTYTFPEKTTGNQWIYVRSSNWQQLPLGVRVAPADAVNMPTVTSNSTNVPTLQTALRTHNVRFIGIEFTHGDFDTNQIVICGPNGPNYPQSEADQARHITFDRCYVHGRDNREARIGIGVDGDNIGVVDCWVSDIHDTSSDAQAIWTFNGSGPFKIQNNYLSAAGENFMTGGSDPAISGLVPSDFEIRGNHFHKPIAWQSSGTWAVKNLFEIKNGQRLLIIGNIFENNWQHAQNGTAIQLTPRNPGDTAPQSACKDVHFKSNVWKNIRRWVNISAEDNNRVSDVTSRVLFEDNLVYDIDEKSISFGTPKGPMQNVHFRHNTIIQNSIDAFMLFDNGGRGTGFYVINGFSFMDNIVNGNNIHLPQNGLSGWVEDHDDAKVQNNVITGSGGNLPSGNFKGVGLNGVGFVDHPNNDYRLATSSPYHEAATDGTDIGWRETSTLDVYVDSSVGSDANAGTFFAPKATIQAAVDQVANGGTVFVAGDTTYNEEVLIDKKDSLTLTGRAYRPGAKPIIDGVGTLPSTINVWPQRIGLVRVRNSQNITIDSIEVTDSEDAGISVRDDTGEPGGYQTKNVTVKNCKVHDIRGHGIIVTGRKHDDERPPGNQISDGNLQNIDTIDNEVTNVCTAVNETGGLNQAGGESLTYQRTDGGTIRGNEIHAYHKEGIDLNMGCKNIQVLANTVRDRTPGAYGAGRGAAVYIDGGDCTGIHIEGNVVSDDSTGIRIGSEQGGDVTNVTVVNNVVFDCLQNAMALHGDGGSTGPPGNLTFIRIYHNTLVGLVGAEAQYLLTILPNDESEGGGVGEFEIKGNLLYRAVAGINMINDNLDTPTLDNTNTSENHFYNGGDAVTGVTGGDPTFGDPLFETVSFAVWPFSTDYYLGAGSPAIDVVQANFLTFDMASQTRGSDADAGAFERV